MRIERDKFINIRKNVEYFRNDATTKLAQIYAVTGYDKACFQHGVGKTKVQPGSFNETNMRLYKQMKTAASQSLPQSKVDVTSY